MKVCISLFVLVFIATNIIAQCDTLSLTRLNTVVRYVDPRYFRNIKFAFEPVGEDSTSYTWARCPWEGEPKCLPYQEYVIFAKHNLGFKRFQCFNEHTYTRIQSEIIKNSHIEEKEGNKFFVYDSAFWVNFYDQDVQENPCNIKKQYFIEFLFKPKNTNN